MKGSPSPFGLLLVLGVPGCIALWGEENIEVAPEVEQRTIDHQLTETTEEQIAFEYAYEGDELVLHVERQDVCSVVRHDTVERAETTIKSHDYLWLEWAAGGLGLTMLGVGVALVAADDEGYYDAEAEGFTLGGWLTTVGAVASLTAVSALVDSIVLMDETEVETHVESSVLRRSVCGTHPLAAPVQLLIADRAVFFGETGADGVLRIPIAALAAEHAYQRWQLAIGDDSPRDLDLSAYRAARAQHQPEPNPSPTPAPPEPLRSDPPSSSE